MTPRSLQARLAVLGHDLGRAGVDGIVGAMTRAALSEFRAARHVAEVGPVGTETALALDAALSGIDVRLPRTMELYDTGTRYVWGAGEPSDFARDDILTLAEGVPTAESRGACGLDCSGQVQGLAVVDGLLAATEPDRTAHSLWRQALDPIAKVAARYGDAAVIDGNGDGRIEHIGTYLAHGWMLHMGGGGRNTHGQDPNACIRVARVPVSATIGRWRASVRPRL